MTDADAAGAGSGEALKAEPGEAFEASTRADRATATTLSYVLTLGITALLISGLLIAAGGAVEQQREDTSREAMEVVGQQLSSRLMAADRLVGAGGSEVVVRGSYPETIAGDTYSIAVRSGSPATIEVTGTGTRVSVSVTAATNTPVADTTVPGGDVEIVYAGGQLEVRDA
ncbi:hypothetical protein Hbl1158_08050 [Halobaculum sp. CBA1158]|uniref:DUF7266 family protein n=1 Tax=Halobaculum sp. CBA1158 TaxID=2904243 RepID=UPI001F2B76D4|nr:hypothetical protein [Halobaculum sp. CBA1158]UIO98515.1 hypothetical protein Hbl1158_08050 [Halobaculum sp. CBA1158]